MNFPKARIINKFVICALTVIPLRSSHGQTASSAPADYLVRDGEPQAVIVIGNNVTPFHRFVAEELQRYITAITGAALEISSVGQPTAKSVGLWILLGGPTVNSLVQQAAGKGLVSFSGLKSDGFVLQTARLPGRKILVVGGNDEASTMYAAYELLEQLGVTFMFNKDILPEKTKDLRLPALSARVETPFPRRGLAISSIYPNRSIWHLSQVKAFLDQMAKLKMNYLNFGWFEHEPWVDFEYRGEHKLLGDATGKESGYMLWRYHYGSYLIKDLPVGQHLFDGRTRMAPREFQDVETPEQAFQVARDFLNEMIRYAKTRKIKMTLSFDPTTLPGNLARYATRAANSQLPFHPILGTQMCPADPILHEINESRLKALATTYPDAEGFLLWIPELYPDCSDERSQSLFLSERPKYDALLKLWAPYTAYERDPDIVLDSNIGSIHIIRKMLEARDRIAPNVRLSIGTIFRGYLMPILDKMFPKTVPFFSMESRAISTPQGVPMQYFGGMGERERSLVHRLDDDSAMFGMQFNVNLYDKDRALEGSAENGVTGLVGQLNRARGTETNYRYWAEGAWNPRLKPKEFYAKYSRRIFGEQAQQDMMAAFETLEENEEFLGWVGRSNFNCCSVLPEIATAYQLYRQPNPFEGPVGWEKFISQSHDSIRYFTQSVDMLKGALRSLEKASQNVAPRGREELNYLRNKTESYILLLQTLITARRAYIAFGEAFRLRSRSDQQDFLRRMDDSIALFTEARQLGRKTTEKFAEVVDHPSDLGVLYRANLFLVSGMELVEQTMKNIWNFHHGRHYADPVAWDKIYYPFPQFSPPW